MVGGVLPSLCFLPIFSYIRRLHFSLKKGRWNAKEEQQLIQLIEKYGVGEFSFLCCCVWADWESLQPRWRPHLFGSQAAVLTSASASSSVLTSGSVSPRFRMLFCFSAGAAVEPRTLLWLGRHASKPSPMLSITNEWIFTIGNWEARRSGTYL